MTGQILSWLGGRVGIRVEVATGLTSEGSLIWDVSNWDEGFWGADDLGWQDITTYTQHVSIDRGQERWGERFKAGSLTLSLDNTSGLFTPESGQDLPGVPWRPGRLVRVVAIPDLSDPGSTVPLFTGRITESNDNYSEAGAWIDTEVTALDALNDLHEFNPIALETATGVEWSEERIISALDRMDWPEELRDLPWGEVQVQTSFLAQTVLEECQRAADAEGGALFAHTDGTITFRPRDWLTTDERSVTSQAYFGFAAEDVPEGADAHDVEAVDVSWELARIRNDIQFARVGSTVQHVWDDDSQALYGKRSYQRLDLINNADIDVLFLAERYLSAYKDNRPRINSVAITANRDDSNEDLNRSFYDTQFGDLVAVNVRTLNGWDLPPRNLHVVGIHHEITPDEWTLSLTLDDSLAQLLDESSSSS